MSDNEGYFDRRGRYRVGLRDIFGDRRKPPQPAKAQKILLAAAIVFAVYSFSRLALAVYLMAI